MNKTKVISAAFPFASQYVDVLGSRLHYIDEGQGDPMVFLHGMPTSNYLWRNIIPTLATSARCIAPDLIGMGKSSKPDISYDIFDHIKYITAFIDALGLRNITLVLHGWGSVIGFAYAMTHQDNIRAVAFYEAHVRPMVGKDMLALPVQQLVALVKDNRTAKQIVVKDNYFIEKLLPSEVIRELSDEEMTRYRTPFNEIAHRQVLWQYLQDLPLGRTDTKVAKVIKQYVTWLEKSSIPKLMFYAVPGFFTTIETVQWCRDHFSHLTLVDLEDSLHFAQESHPEELSSALQSWYLSEVKG